MKIKPVFRALLILAFLALPGCGGGGGGTTTQTADDNPATGGGNVNGAIHGVVVKGPVSGGEVRVYAVRDGQIDTGAVLGIGRTAADGSFTINLFSNPTGPVVLEVTGGVYTDEASGALNVPLKTHMRAAVSVVGDGAKIAVTPLTHLACKQVEAIGAMTATEIDDANVQIGRFFGVSDLIASLPFDPTRPAPAGATNDQKKYAAALGVFSQMVTDGKGGQTLEDALVTLLAGMETELKTNGGFSLATINTLNTAIANFDGSGKNNSGIPLRPVVFTGGVLQLSTAGALPAGAAINGVDFTLTLPAGVAVKADPTTGETLPGVVAQAHTANNGLSMGKFDKAAGTLRVILIQSPPGFSLGEFAHVEFDGFPVGGADFGVKVNRIDGGSGSSSAPLTGLAITHNFAGL